MDLKSGKRQNIQLELDFPSLSVGEACEAGREEIESLSTTHDTESPANTNRLMEEVCERENLKEAFRVVRGPCPRQVFRELHWWSKTCGLKLGQPVVHVSG
jgi:hypothetical protein